MTSTPTNLTADSQRAGRLSYDVGERSDSTSRQRAGIVREGHDEPHVEGNRITVQWIQRRVEERGLEPQTVAGRHDLDVADVYRALTYYHDHSAEMQAVEQRRERLIEENQHLTTDIETVRE